MIAKGCYFSLDHLTTSSRTYNNFLWQVALLRGTIQEVDEVCAQKVHRERGKKDIGEKELEKSRAITCQT